MSLLDYLEQFMTVERVMRMKEILDLRTRYITVILDDIFQPHNISAVLRTCDCFGIQDIHVLQGKNKYALNPDISLGSTQWLNINLYEKQEQSSKMLFKQLREKGYRIVATVPGADSITPTDISLDTPLALAMGSEVAGLSEEAIACADEILKIPMYGFTESYNISVATSLILQTLRNRIQREKILWQLKQSEKDEILLGWYRTSIKESDLIIDKFKTLVSGSQ